MNSEILFLVENSLDGGYEAKALDYPIFTEANSEKELLEIVKDAVRCHFEEGMMPKFIRLHYVKEEVIAV